MAGGNAGGKGANALSSTAPLNGKGLVNAAHAMANAETAGPLAELGAQIAAENAKTAQAAKLTAGYFNSLGSYSANNAGQVGQIGQGLNSQLGQIGADENSRLSQIGQGQLGQMARYAPQSDQGVAQAGTQSLAQALAQQQGLSANDMGALRSQGADQSANFQDLANAHTAAYATQGQQDLSQIQQAGRAALLPLNAKVAEYQDRGKTLFNSDLVKLRQQEITNQIDRGALGIKEQVAQTDANRVRVSQQNDLANQQLKARGLSIEQANDAAKLGLAQQSEAWKQTYQQGELNLKRGGGTLTRNQQNEMINKFGSAVASLSKLKPVNNNRHSMAALLTSGGRVNIRGTKRSETISPINSTLVEAALEYANHGSITAQTAKALKAMGLGSLTYNGSPVRVRQ